MTYALLGAYQVHFCSWTNPEGLVALVICRFNLPRLRLCIHVMRIKMVFINFFNKRFVLLFGMIVEIEMWGFELFAGESLGQQKTRCNKPTTLAHSPKPPQFELGLSMERRFMLHSRACSPWYCFICVCIFIHIYVYSTKSK